MQDNEKEIPPEQSDDEKQQTKPLFLPRQQNRPVAATRIIDRVKRIKRNRKIEFPNHKQPPLADSQSASAGASDDGDRQPRASQQGLIYKKNSDTRRIKRPEAATRIMERVKQRRTRIIARDVDQQGPNEPDIARERIKTAKVPLQPRQRRVDHGDAPEQTAHIDSTAGDQASTVRQDMLDPDLVPMWHALTRKMIQPNDAVQVLLHQAELAKEGKTSSALAIMIEKGWIYTIQAQQLQQAAQQPMPRHSLPLRSTRRDFALAQELIYYNLLTRNEIMQLFSVQRQAHSLGVEFSLENLLALSKHLAPEILQPLCQQLRQKAKAQATPTIEAVSTSRRLTSSRGKYYSLFKWTAAMLALLLLFSAGGLLLLLGNRKTARSPTPCPSPVNILPPFPDQSTQPKPLAVVKKSSPPLHQIKGLQQRLNESGLAKWGDYWISEEQRQFLAQKWPTGKNAAQASLAIKTIAAIYQRQGNQASLTVRGQILAPILPDGLRLRVRLQLYHGLQQHDYAREYFVPTGDNYFDCAVTCALPLAPDVYFVRMTIVPGSQLPFTRYFLGLAQEKSWWFPLRLGKISQIAQRHQDGFARINRLLLGQWQVYQQSIRMLTAESRKATDERQRLHAAVAKLKKVYGNWRQYQRRQLIPLVPDIEARQRALLAKLLKIYHLASGNDKTGESLVILTDFAANFERLQTDLAKKQKAMRLLPKLAGALPVSWR